MLPGAIVIGIMSPIIGRLFDQYGARILAIIGLVIAVTVVTTYKFSQLTLTTSYNTYYPDRVYHSDVWAINGFDAHYD